MKRYGLVQSSDYSIGIEPLQNGGYVRADEAAAEISRLQSALEARTEECAAVLDKQATTYLPGGCSDAKDILRNGAAAIRKLQEQS